MKSFIFGKTTSHLPIPAYSFGSSGHRVLILGGVHGDEIEGVIAAHGLLDKFCKSFSYKLKVDLVPAFNLDGVLNRSRVNQNGVDLNRNLPTSDWTSQVASERYYPGKEANSESENQALVDYIEEKQPQFILSLHSWKPMLNTNGRCKKIAETIAKYTGYEIKDSIGYPTPGCLGTYCGIERDMPTLTYEVERGLNSSAILSTHVKAILEGLKSAEESIS